MEVILELEEDVYWAEGEGDPPRTKQLENAQAFSTYRDAYHALEVAREFRPFKWAKMRRRINGILI